MSQDFDAIYENGVLRPLKPVDLREHELVTVSVSPLVGESGSTLAIADKQREILLAFVAKVDSLADEGSADGYSNRDHDRLIYKHPG